MTNARAFPGFDYLFALLDPVASRPFRSGFSRVAEAAEITRGEIHVTEPVHVPWEMGSHVPGDVIWTTAANAIIVSSRTVDLLLDHRFTGWCTYPVRVSGKFDEVITGYYGLSVVGRCGPIDYSRSEVVLREYPAGWFPHLRGKFFDPESWDGSDFFMEAPDSKGKITGSKFVTETVKRVLTRAKVRNLTFERISEADFDLSAIEIGSQHRLPADIQERVERAYAEHRSAQ